MFGVRFYVLMLGFCFVMVISVVQFDVVGWQYFEFWVMFCIVDYLNCGVV